MDRALEQQVWRRASNTCEYCQMPQAYDVPTFEIDHIVAIVHGGLARSGNLALSCFWCNRHKGPNLAGIDPKTRRHSRLFHPRRHSWHRHFVWDGPILVGRTAVGRTTITVLAINHPLRVRLRRELFTEGLFPQ